MDTAIGMVLESGLAISIRPMTIDDAEDVEKLVLRAFRDAVAPYYSEKGVKTFEVYASARSLLDRLQTGERAYVAVRAGEIVGMIAVKPPGHLPMLFVDPARQRAGIGRRLLEQAICALRADSAASISLNATPNALEAYRAMGFEVSGGQREVDGIVFTPMALKIRSGR
jgi:ribosomal protein S18 acetylase RimI-like enzyme